MRTVFNLQLACTFLILAVFGAFGCHGAGDGDVRDNLAPYYLVTLSGVENTCGMNGEGGGPADGSQLPVGVEATSATTFNFALGGGTENPLIVPGVEVDADGIFAAEIPLVMGPDSPPGVLEFAGSVTPDEMDADLALRVGWDDENGNFVEYCRIAASLTGPPCGPACDSL